MIVRNTVIIIADNSELSSTGFEDAAGFSGNQVISRSDLPQGVVEQLDKFLGASSDRHRAAQIKRPAVDQETGA